MDKIIDLIILVIETIRNWFSSKNETKKQQEEELKQTEEKLQDVVQHGSLADLQNIAHDLKKGHKS